MTVPQPYEQMWRGKAAFVASKLERAHSAVEVLGTALEKGDTRTVRRNYSSARREVASVAQEVNSLRSEQPSTESMEDATATGSTLTIRGSGVATIALDVMVDAMAALTTVEDKEDTDLLIGACIDAERAYEDCTAVVKAVSRAHGPALGDLKRAFDTQGEVALRKRVRDARPRVHEVSDRLGVTGPA
jgi:hypothetical protein